MTKKVWTCQNSTRKRLIPREPLQLTRVKKEFENALKALTEASSSQYFFDELIKVQDIYKEKRKVVLNISLRA